MDIREKWIVDYLMLFFFQCEFRERWDSSFWKWRLLNQVKNFWARQNNRSNSKLFRLNLRFPQKDRPITVRWPIQETWLLIRSRSSSNWRRKFGANWFEQPKTSEKNSGKLEPQLQSKTRYWFFKLYSKL